MNGTRDQGFEGLGILNGTHTSQKVLGYILDASTILLLVIIMMSLGCTLQLSELKKFFLKPKEVGVAIFAQYGIMPLSAFSLGHAFRLNAMESLAILICGCCPGGNLSNIFTLAIKGDMNLSILMTVCSNIIALGMMPFLLYIYGLGMNAGQMHTNIPFIKIMISLIITVLPCCAGMLMNSKRPQYSQCFIKVKWTRRTICMETGCQNVQLCSAILKVTFDPDVVGPYFMFPLLYFIFQILMGLFLILLFRLYDRINISALLQCLGALTSSKPALDLMLKKIPLQERRGTKESTNYLEISG
ncbi:hepatic sodium/bile acid cotransporter [Mantella aurantiaca]